MIAVDLFAVAEEKNHSRYSLRYCSFHSLNRTSRFRLLHNGHFRHKLVMQGHKGKYPEYRLAAFLKIVASVGAMIGQLDGH